MEWEPSLAGICKMRKTILTQKDELKDILCMQQSGINTIFFYHVISSFRMMKRYFIKYVQSVRQRALLKFYQSTLSKFHRSMAPNVSISMKGAQLQYIFMKQRDLIIHLLKCLWRWFKWVKLHCRFHKQWWAENECNKISIITSCVDAFSRLRKGSLHRYL